MSIVSWLAFFTHIRILCSQIATVLSIALRVHPHIKIILAPILGRGELTWGHGLELILRE